MKLGYRPLTTAQQRELREQWLAARVILHDFAGRRCCSREIVINLYVNLDELINILCAAIAFTDDEHLWRLQLPDRTVDGGQWARPTTLQDLALKPAQAFYCQYDFGDNWQFYGSPVGSVGCYAPSAGSGGHRPARVTMARSMSAGAE